MNCTLFALLLALACGSVGCGSASHEPAVRVMSTTIDNRLTLGAGKEVNRETIQESRFRDAAGRKWAETTVLTSEQVPLAQIEAELFVEAQRKAAAERTASDR